MKTVYAKDTCKDFREIISEVERKLEPAKVYSDTRPRQIYEAAKGRKVKFKTRNNVAYIVPTKGVSTFMLKKGKNREDGRKCLAEFAEWIKNGKGEVALVEWGGVNGYTYNAACAKLNLYRDSVDLMFTNGQETSTWVIKNRTQENADQIKMGDWVETASEIQSAPPKKEDVYLDLLSENEQKTVNVAAAVAKSIRYNAELRAEVGRMMLLHMRTLNAMISGDERAYKKAAEAEIKNLVTSGMVKSAGEAEAEILKVISV